MLTSAVDFGPGCREQKAVQWERSFTDRCSEDTNAEMRSTRPRRRIWRVTNHNLKDVTLNTKAIVKA